jgi:hypothetical protein
MTSPITPAITPTSAIKTDDLSVLFSEFVQSLVKALAPEETKPESSTMPMSTILSSLLYQIALALILQAINIDVSNIISPHC